MKHKILLICIVFSTVAFSQSKLIEKKFSLTSGYGAAGSFFVRLRDYAYKKNFLGTNLNFALGYKIGKKSEMELRYTREEFSKRLIFSNNINIFVNSNIRHINNFFELIYDRKLVEKHKSILKAGLGIYYLRAQQEEVDVGTGGIDWEERNVKYNGLEDAGALIEAAYEWKFQPRVNIGIRTQFYYTISAGNAESITFYPYIKISF